MLKIRSNWKPPLITLFVVIFLLTLMAYSGSARYINVVLQDWLTLSAPKDDSTIAVVEVNENAGAVIQDIKDAQPNRVFWVLPDTPLQVEQIELIERHSIYTVKIPGRGFDSKGTLINTSSSTWQPSAGYLLPPIQYQGVARTIPLFSSDEIPLSAPAAVLYREKMDLDNIQSNQNEHYIDFANVSPLSPVLTSSLQSNKALLQKMVAGRDVWMVPDTSLMDATITTPQLQGRLGWLPVQYHAAALQAFEQQHYFRLVSFTSTLLTVFFILTALTVMVVYLPPKWKGSLGGLVNLVMVLTGSIIFWLFGYIPPIFEMLMASMVFWLMTRRQFKYLRRDSLYQLNELLTRQVAALSVKPTEQRKFWDNVVSLVTQSLYLEKSIFLEIYEPQRRLREIAALNCSIEDIAEQRRDITREPYHQAVLAKQSKISSRHFFKNHHDDEVEILAPLFKGTEILGFWALATKETDERRLRQLQDYVDLFAMQISTLLHMQKLSEYEQSSSHLLAERFGNQEQQTLNLVKQKLDTLVSTEYLYNSLYKSMATPAVLFDVFGRIAMHNNQMTRLAKYEKLRLTDINAYEFLKQLIPNEDLSLKNTIRQLSLENNVPAQRYFVNLNGHEYIVVLSSVHKEQDYVVGQEVAIGLNGLLCEFHSLREVQHQIEVERSLYDNYIIHIKNHLSALQMGMLQIQGKTQDSLIQQLSHYLTEELNKASEITRKTHYFMNRLEYKSGVHSVPFNPTQILQALLKEAESGQQEYSVWRDVTFDAQLSLFTTLALGDPDVFREVVRSALKLLVDDAVAPKKIAIYGRQIQRNDVDILYIKLEAEGYGIPDEQIQKLSEQEAVIGEQTYLTNLLNHLKKAQSTNMECRLKSKVGKGYRLSILLEGINLND